MKRKVASIITIGLCCLSLAACGKEVIATSNDKNEKMTNMDYETRSLETRSEMGSHSLEQNLEEVKGVFLGGDFETDYDGFTYLYCEELATEATQNETTGKMEKQEIAVFIPIGDYSSVNRDTAYSEKMGVDFRVSLNPYIRYDGTDYLVSENLQYFLENEYDPFYSTDYKNLYISEIENTKDGAKATVSYCYYDQWNQTYIPQYVTYYLNEVSKDITVLVEVKVDLAEATGKTPALLAELEEFYGFDIEWDEKEAKDMVEQFLADKDHQNETFSTGYLMFTLPSDWDRDYEYGDYSEYAYAPTGDAAFAGCVISFSREYMGSDSFNIADVFSSEEETQAYMEYLREILGEGVKQIDISDYGNTCMGNAIKVTYEITDDMQGNVQWYMITDEDYAYSMQVVALSDCDIDVSEIAENILQNGILKK